MAGSTNVPSVARTPSVRGRVTKRRRGPPRRPARTTSMQTDPLTTPGVITAPGKSFGPLGKSYKTTLRIAFTLNLDAAQGSTADAVFSANGIAKPYVSDVTSSRQCYAHDQLVSFFDHYTVIGSKCRVTSSNQNTIPLYLGAAIRDNSTLITEGNHILRSAPGTSMSLMSPTQSGDCLKSVEMTYSPNRFFGKSKGNVVGESELRGNMGTVASNLDMPAEQAYYHVLCSPQQPSDNPGPNVVQVEIEYTVVLTEPKAMSQHS